MSDGGSATDHASAEGSTSARSRLRGTIVRGAIALAVLLGLGWIAAVTGVGMGTVVPYALERFSPEGWSVQVGGAEGNWLERVELTGVEVVSPAFRFGASRLLLRYRLRPLLGKRLELEELIVADPEAHIVLADSAPPPEDDTSGSVLSTLLSGRPAGSWAVNVAAARISGGQVEVQSHGGHRYT
ncbi:MAG: hypothetical protein KJO65_08935, partial [Gemmatimonadetes bacterium]|nr:hypothetical protein [Gemmatimonadota bacterium]